jgi:hypothetical protein
MTAQIIIKPVRIISTEDAALYCGGNENLKRIVTAKYVKPLGGKNRGMDFDIRDLDVALDRVNLDGWPS